MGDDYHEEGWEKDGKNAFDDYGLINEILSQHFSEDLKNLKVMLRLQLQQTDFFDTSNQHLDIKQFGWDFEIKVLAIADLMHPTQLRCLTEPYVRVG